jgi:GAF domain-containing protein
MSAADEAARQRALDTYHIVDSLPETAYDDIARLAAMLCDAPVALISLLDRDRQWFKARVGFEPRETAREHAVCDHAIREPTTLFEVTDLSGDARFAGNPVLEGVGARFYAGMPLVTPAGAAVGTVCVLDRAPRTLTQAQREALASLARLAMNLMEGRRKEREHAVADTIGRAAAPLPEDHRVSVALFEAQGLSAWVARAGDRAVERALHELDGAMGTGLRAGDTVTRVTGSGEFVVALHGPEIAHALRRLADTVAAFEQRHGATVLSGVAGAGSPGESPTAIYLRAYEELLAAKDRLHEAEAVL